MATIEELESKLINAHEKAKGGDTKAAEHAKMFAAEIRRLKSSDTDTTTEEIRQATLAQSRNQMSHPSNPEKAPVDWSADEMPGWKQVAAGAGKTVMDTGMGINQILGITSQEEVDASLQNDQALMQTGGGVTGNVAGHVGMALGPGAMLKGMSMIPKAAPYASTLNNLGNAIMAPKTVTGGAAVGGAYMGTQPVQTGGSRMENMAYGAGFGGAVPLLINSLRGGKAFLEPRSEAGRSNIAGRVLRQQAGENADDVSVRMSNASEIVPGSQPTAGEVADNAGIARLQRAVAAKDPLANFNERAIDQRIARANAVKEIAGTPEDMAAAEAARKKATAPLYNQVNKSDAVVDPTRTANLIDRIIKNNQGRSKLVKALTEVRESMATHFPAEQRAKEAWDGLNAVVGKRMSAADLEAVKKARTIMNRVKMGKIDADEALAQLKGIKGESKTASEAIDYATTRMKDADYVLMENPRQLQSASKNIGDLINAKGPGGEKVNEAIVKELTTIKKSLDHQINKAEPAYGAAQKEFADASKPINQMKVAQELEKKLIPALTENRQTADSYATVLRDKDRLAAKATGFKRAKLDDVMTPEQMQVLNNVKDDAARSANVDILGKGGGSDTVEKLSMGNLLDQAAMPRWAQNMPFMKGLKDFGGLGLYGDSDAQIRSVLARALLNPQEGARLMNSAPTRNKIIEGLRLLNIGSGSGASSQMITPKLESLQ